MKKIIELQNITKYYFPGLSNEVKALDGITLDVHEGEFVAIVGESGSGKSTLMNIIGVLDRPTNGKYCLSGLDISKQPDHTLAGIRNQKVGFVFQDFNLIGRSSAKNNVELPMIYAQIPTRERRKRTDMLLKMVEMDQRGNHYPNELSGGQKQRISIARAMANNPDIILADEPTGALDSETGRLVMDIFHRLHRDEGKTIILITHSPSLAKETQRIITLKDGVITDVRPGLGLQGDKHEIS